MPNIEDIARRHDFPLDATQNLLRSLVRGGGRSAQFDHPALGGMGQWSAGGMIMIGAMSDHTLKARVAALCDDLAPLAGEHANNPDAASGTWWPPELGTPSSAGSQNDARYAVFPQVQRLAIETNGRVAIYDTGDHMISGVSQQQGSSRDLAFASQHGTVRVHDLKPVGPSAQPVSAHAKETTSAPVEHREAPDDHAPGAPHIAHGRTTCDPLGMLERLHALHGKGVLIDAEFSAKKAELLSRI